jgi:hypothetical protein
MSSEALVPGFIVDELSDVSIMYVDKCVIVSFSLRVPGTVPSMLDVAGVARAPLYAMVWCTPRGQMPGVSIALLSAPDGR